MLLVFVTMNPGSHDPGGRWGKVSRASIRVSWVGQGHEDSKSRKTQEPDPKPSQQVFDSDGPSGNTYHSIVQFRG